MLLAWDFYWPALIAAVVIGVVAGALAYRGTTSRKRRLLAIGGGVAATILTLAVWHGPVGTAERFRGSVETAARTTLADFEMAQVQARLGNGVLGRTLVLSGPADDFQRAELVRIMSHVPGVAHARWTGSRAGPFELPLLLEMELWSLVAFGLGLLLSYLVELRRRAHAEWRW